MPIRYRVLPGGRRVVDAQVNDVRAITEPATASAPRDVTSDGSIDDVLRTVGNSKARAESALRSERAKSKPRSTLIRRLEKLRGMA
jgi:hypothetical protein